MFQPSLPPLSLADWRPSRDTVHGYAKVLGRVRRALTPRQKHWWHVSLRTAAAGLTTTPIAAGDFTFEMLLDFTAHLLVITTSRGERMQSDLRGQSPASFLQTNLEMLAVLGIRPEIDAAPFAGDAAGDYDSTAVTAFWQALAQIDMALKLFQSELRQETSPVQFWPHHFDLAMVWFSGRLVPGEDPDNEEYADEQMNFGFSTGDESIGDGYFYVTAYPRPDGWPATPLPEPATWHTAGWQGAVLPYKEAAAAVDPLALLLDFWRAAHRAGAELMRDTPPDT